MKKLMYLLIATLMVTFTACGGAEEAATEETVVEETVVEEAPVVEDTTASAGEVATDEKPA